MTKTIELEKTYLAKYLPEDLQKFPSKEITDWYFPTNATHPRLRLRRMEDRYELTKKAPETDDASRQIEQTITLTQGEYDALARLPAKRSDKFRYYYPYWTHTAEITIFRGALAGLVLVDFEFQSVEEMNNFEMPDFCLADVTQEDCVAGGILAGKSYQDIEHHLARFHYTPIFIQDRS